MPCEQSDWEWRNEEMTGDDFIPVKLWAWRAGGAGKLYNHEAAANAVARSLTADDPDYYKILENDGIDMEIRSPSGEIKRMRAGGFTDFIYTSDEVATI